MIKAPVVICWIFAGLTAIIGFVNGYIARSEISGQVWFALGMYFCFRAATYTWEEHEKDRKDKEQL